MPRRRRSAAARLGAVTAAALAVERADLARDKQRRNPPRKPPPLDELRDDGVITHRQHRAGAWLAALYVRAGRMPRVTARFDDTPPGRSASDWSSVDAERAISATMRAAGVLGSAVLIHVVVLDNTLGSWARGLRAREADAVEILREALDATARVREDGRQ